MSEFYGLGHFLFVEIHSEKILLCAILYREFVLFIVLQIFTYLITCCPKKLALCSEQLETRRFLLKVYILMVNLNQLRSATSFYAFLFKQEIVKMVPNVQKIMKMIT